MRGFIIAVLVLGVGGGLYYFYNAGYFSNKDRFWDMVPGDAAWVYTHENAWALWRTRIGGSHVLGEALKKEVALQAIFHQALSAYFFDSVRAASLFEGQRVMMSGHRVGERYTGWVWYFQLGGQSDQALASFLSYLHEDRGFRRANRLFRDVHVEEILSPSDTLRWSYVVNNGYLVLSSYPFLIEEVVRTTQDDHALSFMDKRKKFRRYSKIAGQDGLLYVDPQLLLHWFSAHHPSSADMEGGGGSLGASLLQLDVSLEPKIATLSGYLTYNDTASTLFSTFEETATSKLAWEWLVPNRVVSLSRYLFENALSWNVACISEELPFVQERLALFSRYQIDVEEVFSRLKRMVMVMDIEVRGQMERICVMEQQRGSLRALWKQWNTQLEKGYTSAIGEHKGYSLYYLPIADLPRALFGDAFEGFSELFYVEIQDFVLACSSRQALIEAIDDIDGERTWGRTPDIQVQLHRALPNANISFMVQLQKDSRFHPFFPASKEEEERPRLAIFQYQKQGASFFHQTVWHLPRRLGEAPSPLVHASLGASAPATPAAPPSPLVSSQGETFADDAYEKVSSLALSSSIIVSPMVLFNGGEYDVFVQEEKAYTLYGFSSRGKVYFARSLEGPLVSLVYAMDYYRRGEKHYVFATAEKIYVIDRQGKILPGFPVSLPDTSARIAYMRLLDYDKNKRYRYFIADILGRAWVLNAQGKALEGWRPLSLSPLSQAPFHVRLGPRDAMVLPQKDGNLQVYRRSGRSFVGFPVEVDPAGLVSDVYVRVEKEKPLSSRFIVLGKSGVLQSFDLEGNLEQEVRLPSSTGEETMYRLVKARSGNGFVILVWQSGLLRVYDSSGEPLFERPWAGKEMWAQYYAFDSDHQILVLTDITSNSTYFYHMDGKEALPSPVASMGRIGLVYQRGSQSYTIFSAIQKEYRLLRYGRYQ